jgi:hypothetical protein
MSWFGIVVLLRRFDKVVDESILRNVLYIMSMQKTFVIISECGNNQGASEHPPPRKTLTNTRGSK